jgi:hypothetical protein
MKTRELKVLDAKPWFSRARCEKLIKTVPRPERTILRRDPATGLWMRGCETVFWVSSASDFSPEQWSAWTRGRWRIENGRSAIDRKMTPPSEARRPPSKSAGTFLRDTNGNENGGRPSSIMAGVAGELWANSFDTKILRRFRTANQFNLVQSFPNSRFD